MGQLTLGEQAAPSTPGSGVAIYTTVATPSILRVKDDGGGDYVLGAVASGVWTPTILGSSTPGTQTYSAQTGRYIKIGSLVMAWFNVVMTAKDGATAGNMSVGGLPFTVAATASFGGYSGNISNFTALATNVVWLGIRASVNTVTCGLFKLAAAGTGSASVVAADIAATTQIIGMISYEAA